MAQNCTFVRGLTHSIMYIAMMLVGDTEVI